MSPVPALIPLLLSRDAGVQATNGTGNALQVVCAWPVSGQYGPGSRVLYYFLVAACVFARKARWLRNACLAAALLFPAVAAIHAIVLTALHVEGAVDLDVFGAFQLCSIGILAAPITVKLSRTYFYDPGRNIIFVWTLVVLAGLLSLTVEFFRIKTSDCRHDDAGNPISTNIPDFPYAEDFTCGLTCSIKKGPFSPMRDGATNNIYVVPAPNRLTFGTAVLLAAACCIPAVLSLVSMWNKILEINYKNRFGGGDEDEHLDEPIEGTNGATITKMRSVEGMIKSFLSVVEVPVYMGAVLALLIIGERNFFSQQLQYQTEPLESIGQWAPIAGTGFAALGSLYLLLAQDMEAVEAEARSNAVVHHCDCLHHRHDGSDFPNGASPPAGEGTGSPPMQQINRQFSTASLHSVAASDMGHRGSAELGSTISRPSPAQTKRAGPTDAYRRVVASALTKFGEYIGTPERDWRGDIDFQQRALRFPEIPGEENRNPTLSQIRDQFNRGRSVEGSPSPGSHHSRSRAGSMNGSIASGLESDGSRGVSPFPSPAAGRRLRTSTMPPSTQYRSPSLRRHIRRDTLEVPPTARHSHTRNVSAASSSSAPVTMTHGEGSPVIVVSSDPDSPSPPDSPASDRLAPQSSIGPPPAKATLSPSR